MCRRSMLYQRGCCQGDLIGLKYQDIFPWETPRPTFLSAHVCKVCKLRCHFGALFAPERRDSVSFDS